MTTPDPAALRKALKKPWPVHWEKNSIINAARWALDLIEGGKEDKAAHLLYWGWTVIANAGGGDWTRESPEWVDAATRWRDEFHAFLDEMPHLKPVEKP